VVLGVGRIHAVDIGTGVKVRARCPQCRSTDYKFRINKTPPFRCAHCTATFTDLDRTDERAVRTYSADYSGTWSPADSYFPVAALTSAYLSRAQMQSIRRLHPHRLRPILRAHLVPDLWWSQDHDGDDLGGGFAIALGKSRLGQQRFREEMLRRYGPRCAFTGPQPPAALEAAHIRSYGTSPRHERSNGLLLRRDLHALFDRGLLTVDPRAWTVDVAPTLRQYPDIAALQGQPLDVPIHLRPSMVYIKEHAAQARASWRTAAASVAELART
jgi:hypothetical protein